jgi:hypothetical protein
MLGPWPSPPWAIIIGLVESELSYTAQVFANGWYSFEKFLSPAAYPLRMTCSATSCPPAWTRARTRCTARVGTPQPKKHQLEGITIDAQLPNPAGVVFCRQRSLESESLSLLGELTQSIQHYASRLQGDTSWIETRKAVRYRIGIDVFQYSQLVAQKKRRQGRFPRAVRACDYYNLRRCFAHRSYKPWSGWPKVNSTMCPSGSRTMVK